MRYLEPEGVRIRRSTVSNADKILIISFVNKDNEMIIGMADHCNVSVGGIPAGNIVRCQRRALFLFRQYWIYITIRESSVHSKFESISSCNLLARMKRDEMK